MKKGRNAEEQHIIVSAFSNGQGHLFLFWDGDDLGDSNLMPLLERSAKEPLRLFYDRVIDVPYLRDQGILFFVTQVIPE